MEASAIENEASVLRGSLEYMVLHTQWAHKQGVSAHILKWSSCTSYSLGQAYR